MSSWLSVGVLEETLGGHSGDISGSVIPLLSC